MRCYNPNKQLFIAIFPGKKTFYRLKRVLKKFHPTTTQIIMMAFLGAILIGTALLMLPFATATGERCSFLTALFTSTTSVCVTGLVVVDTFSYWNLFGQIAILLLIQIGGLGVITIWVERRYENGASFNKRKNR